MGERLKYSQRIRVSMKQQEELKGDLRKKIIKKYGHSRRAILKLKKGKINVKVTPYKKYGDKWGYQLLS